MDDHDQTLPPTEGNEEIELSDVQATGQPDGDATVHSKASNRTAENAGRSKLDDYDQTRTHEDVATHVSSSVAVEEQIGPYRILKVLGEGGMGSVYLAEQSKPVRRRVALKIIKSGMDSDQVIARFEAERQALAMMDHGNIAKVFDAGTTPSGRPFFAMELVPGTPITQFCDRQKLGINQRLQLFRQVCNAVQHAHQKGVIHRDLKPSNILVAIEDQQPVCKVIDFGLAKATNQQLTEKTMFTAQGQVLGTLEYMSPEQANLNDLDVDTRSDIYSLGVTLYELLTGTTPLKRETIRKSAFVETLRRIKEEEPERPSSRVSNAVDGREGFTVHRQIEPRKLTTLMRGELDWVVLRALEKDRNRRYQTASAIAGDITAFLEGNAVSARPPSTRYLLTKFANRNKTLVTSSALIFATLLIAIIGTSWGMYRARKSERETSIALEQNEQTLARSNYLLAVARWDDDRAAEANELLDQVEPRLRNFEWFLARRQFLGGYLTCYGHHQTVLSVDVNQAGNRVASAGEDGTIRLWDAASGEELWRVDTHSEAVHCVAFSPDGTLLVSGSSDSTTQLWEVETGKELRSFRRQALAVATVCFSPDGKMIASGNWDSRISLWEVKTGVELATWKAHKDAVTCVRFSPDGTQLASASWDRSVKIWDVSTQRQLRLLELHQDMVMGVAFSPDGRRLASAGIDGIVGLWDTATGDKLWALDGQLFPLYGVSYSPDGATLLTGGIDNMLRLLDTKTGKEIRTLKGHCDEVYCFAFNSEGTMLASGGADRTIKFWDVTTGNATTTLWGHEAIVSSADFSPNGETIVSGSNDRSIKLWNATTRKIVKTLHGHAGEVTCVHFSPDGSRLVSGSYDKTVKIWNVATGEAIRKLKGHTALIKDVAFTPDGLHVASASEDGTVRLWDVANGTELRVFRGHQGLVTCITFSPNGRYMVSGGYDDTVRVWNSQTGQQLRMLQGHGNAIHAISFHPDGVRVASGDLDGVAKLWDTRTGDALWTNIGIQGINDVSFSQDGTRLVLGRINHRVALLDTSTGLELRALEGHSDAVDGVAFSPDGGRIVSASADCTLMLWEAVDGEEIRTLRGHSGSITQVSFGDDDRRIYSETASGERMVWDVQTGKQLKTAPWQAFPTPRHQSKNGRWLVTPFKELLRIVDLDFKHRSGEANFRASKCLPRPDFHREKAQSAESTDDWYSATFHWALVMDGQPDQSAVFEQFHRAHKKLVASMAESENQQDVVLPPIVREMLDRPRQNQ